MKTFFKIPVFMRPPRGHFFFSMLDGLCKNKLITSKYKGSYRIQVQVTYRQVTFIGYRTPKGITPYRRIYVRSNFHRRSNHIYNVKRQTSGSCSLSYSHPVSGTPQQANAKSFRPQHRIRQGVGFRKSFPDATRARKIDI